MHGEISAVLLCMCVQDYKNFTAMFYMCVCVCAIAVLTGGVDDAARIDKKASRSRDKSDFSKFETTSKFSSFHSARLFYGRKIADYNEDYQ